MTSRRSHACSCLALVAAVALAAFPAGAVTEVEVGHVVAVEGVATAGLPGEPVRSLVCGDPVHEDEVLTTSTGSRLVIARAGRHIHLADETRLLLRRGVATDPTAVLLDGSARVLDTSDLPEARVQTPAGDVAFLAADIEIRRVDGGALQVCEWSSANDSVCQRIEPNGRVWPVVEEGPHLDLGLRNVCDWLSWDGIRFGDFASSPAVSSPAAPAAPGFEPIFEFDEPGCAGDECTPAIDPQEPTPPEIVYTVDPVVTFNPLGN